jgi:Protein of unknown function (DUF2798)
MKLSANNKAAVVFDKRALLFGLLLSGLMSLIVSGVTTLRTIGLIDAMPRLWLSAWLFSWLVAFPCVTLLAPLVRRIVQRVLP